MAAYEVLLLNTAVPQIQAAQSGDTYVVPRDIAFSAALTLSAGTANGVPYLDGSKVLTTGSALTFNGSSTLTLTDANPRIALTNNSTGSTLTDYGSGGGSFYVGADNSTGSAFGTSAYARVLWGVGNYPMVFAINNSEQMRLTSTGLGIGTNLPTTKLDVVGSGDGDIRIRAGSDAALIFSETTANKNWKLKPSAGDFYWQYSGTAYNSGYSAQMALTSSGNLGLGVTPSAQDSTYKSLQIGGGAFLFNNVSGPSSCFLYANAYQNSSNVTTYYGNAAASGYLQNAGSHAWYTAASGTAGDPISFTQALTLDANRNLLLNGTSAPASGVGTFAIFNGTAPTGSVTDGIVLYAEDVSSSSELKVRDEAGNVTTLSPHNFELIPEGPSEDMAWSYYSERDGKRINVDMLKAIRLLEKLSGEKLVHFA